MNVFYVAEYNSSDMGSNEIDEILECVKFFKSRASATAYLTAKYEDMRVDYYETLKEDPQAVRHYPGSRIEWGPGQVMRIFGGRYIS